MVHPREARLIQPTQIDIHTIQINTTKNKNHVIISVDSDNAFDNTPSWRCGSVMNHLYCMHENKIVNN